MIKSSQNECCAHKYDEVGIHEDCNRPRIVSIYQLWYEKSYTAWKYQLCSYWENTGNRSPGNWIMYTSIPNHF